MSARPKCLYCGKPLRAEMTTIEREATPAEIERYEAWRKELDRAVRVRNCAMNQTALEAAQAAYDKLSNKRIPYPFKLVGSDKLMVRVSEPTGHYGQSGLGLFCKRFCGELFGVEAARAGYRMVKR